MIAAGIDAGSRAIKVVLIDIESCEVLGLAVADQGVRQEELARETFERALCGQGLTPHDVAGIVATGYARHHVSFADEAVTEITCHARGVSHEIPEARTVIEIGGQDSKLLRLNPSGSVRDFAMNDRCAAGTGRFLEMVARRLEIPLDALGPLAARSLRPAAISSMCVVFAETEIIGLLAAGADPADIVAGVEASIASRIASLAGGLPEPPAIFTGGVALVPGMPEAIGRALDLPVRTAPRPQFTGALGAALIAAESRDR